jgi:hypothetical protein
VRPKIGLFCGTNRSQNLLKDFKSKSFLDERARKRALSSKYEVDFKDFKDLKDFDFLFVLSYINIKGGFTHDHRRTGSQTHC